MSNRLTWKGDKALSSIEKVAEEALWLLGQQVLTDAAPDVPVDTGTLLRSGRVTSGELPDPDATYGDAQVKQEFHDEPQKSKEVYVSYSTPYAIRLHESPDWHGRLKPRARWKWLERAIPKSRRKFRTIVKRAFDKVGGI